MKRNRKEVLEERVPIAIIKTVDEKLGEEGHNEVIEFLENQGWTVVANKIPAELTRTQLGRKITNLLLRCTGTKFDLLAKKGDEIRMIDVKTKGSLKGLGWVNVDDYPYYVEFNKVVPYWLYFYVKENKKIYLHRLHPESTSKYERKIAAGAKEVYVISRDEIEEAV